MQTMLVTGAKFRLLPRFNYRQRGSLEDPWNVLIMNKVIVRWLSFAIILEWYK